MVHITVISCCSNSCCQISAKLLASFAFQRITRVEITELLRHKIPYFTPDVASQVPNRPNLSSVDYRLLAIERHSGTRLSETAGDVKRR